MTRKEARRRLAAALREQRAAQEEVRSANARVVEATSKLPPHYVDEHRRFAPGERAQIQKLIDIAQRASDRLASATADVVNLRGLVGSEKTSPDQRHLATKRRPGKKTPQQLDREIAQSLSAGGEPQLAAIFADPEATKVFARELRHEIQKRQTSQKTAAALAARPFTVKRLEGGRRELFGRHATEAEARAAADRVGGWVEHGGRVVHGRAPSDHARRRSHSTKAMSNGLFAVEIDCSEFDSGRDLPTGARWRTDRVKLAEDELARGRSYRRPKDARYAVIEWTGYRGEVGRLLDWLEGSPGITRYAEIFE